MKKERLVYVNIGLPSVLVDKIDETRDRTPISEYLRNFILANQKELIKKQIA